MERLSPHFLWSLSFPFSPPSYIAAESLQSFLFLRPFSSLSLMVAEENMIVLKFTSYLCKNLQLFISYFQITLNQFEGFQGLSGFF